MTPLRSVMAAALGILAAAEAHAQARTVRMSSSLGERVFAILLPAGYESSGLRYPVVYLFHGGGQDHSAFMARTAFAPMARRHPVIVVMPAADRNHSAMGPEAQRRYHDYVATELVDYVDSQYRTIAAREGRAIGGLSMGGRIAAMTALRHPDRFAVAGGFSAALRPDALAAVNASEGSAPFFYVSCGTADALLQVNREFVAALRSREVAHEYREAPGQGHTWVLWDEEIAAFFDLLSARGLRPR